MTVTFPYFTTFDRLGNMLNFMEGFDHKDALLRCEQL